jgi:hypothetical protein
MHSAVWKLVYYLTDPSSDPAKKYASPKGQKTTEWHEVVDSSSVKWTVVVVLSTFCCRDLNSFYIYYPHMGVHKGEWQRGFCPPWKHRLWWRYFVFLSIKNLLKYLKKLPPSTSTSSLHPTPHPNLPPPPVEKSCGRLCPCLWSELCWMTQKLTSPRPQVKDFAMSVIL